MYNACDTKTSKIIKLNYILGFKLGKFSRDQTFLSKLDETLNLIFISH